MPEFEPGIFFEDYPRAFFGAALVVYSGSGARSFCLESPRFAGILFLSEPRADFLYAFVEYIHLSIAFRVWP